MNGEWDARIIDDGPAFELDSRRVVLFRRLGQDGIDFITGFDERGVAVTQRVGHSADHRAMAVPGLYLPYDAIVALGERIKPGPSSAEIGRLEESLRIERGRVDRILDSRLP